MVQALDAPKKIGDYTSDAQEKFLKTSVEDWVFDMVKFFYQAHSAKVKSEVFKENQENKLRLVNITNIKFRRGTAEQGDLLKAKASHSMSKIQYNQIQEVLHSFWNQLVVQIKLSSDWLNVDPNIIPINTDTIFQESLSLCEKNLLQTPQKVKAYELQKKASEPRT